MNRVHIARAFCDDHLAECWFKFDEQTGQATHIESYTTESKRLESLGYIYTGHQAGAYTYSLRKSSPLAGIPLPLDWQMALDARESIDQDQDW